MPETFLTNHASAYLKVYDEFYKQAQYKMSVFEKCEDPNDQDAFGFNITYPTNTYYPKGTYSFNFCVCIINHCHFNTYLKYRNHVCKTILSDILLLFWRFWFTINDEVG